jgi:hypothetical protein
MIKDENGKDGFRRLTHYHNLPDTWIPEEMLHMYFQFFEADEDKVGDDMREWRIALATLCELPPQSVPDYQRG